MLNTQAAALIINMIIYCVLLVGYLALRLGGCALDKAENAKDPIP
jgi:hypothetical protein